MSRTLKTRHRCGNTIVTKNGERHRCLKRKSLRLRIEQYITPPKCPGCGSRKHWYVENHRQQGRDISMRAPCRCPFAAWFPHRPGSLLGCDSAPRYGKPGDTDMALMRPST